MANLSKPARYLVRGGRITRYRGIVGGCAPFAMAAVALGAGMAVPGFSPANAADECGIIADGETAHCDQSGNPYADGIAYSGSGITVDLDGTDVIVDTTPSGNIGVAVSVSGEDGARINASEQVSITTIANDAHGIYADSDGNNGNISVDTDAVINTAGVGAMGVRVFHAEQGDVSIQSAGSITTTGASSGAIRVDKDGGMGLVYVSSSSLISTLEDNSIGISANHNATGNIILRSSGNVSTMGNVAHGLGASHTGDGSININAQASITTSGDTASGIRAGHEGNGAILITNLANITTNGTNAHGISAVRSNDGELEINTFGDIDANGANSHGIRLTNSGNDLAKINVLSGTVTGGTGLSAGILLNSDGGTRVEIAAGATVDGTDGAAAIWSVGGPSVILSEGTLLHGIDTTDAGDNEDRLGFLTGSVSTGDMRTGAGDDQFFIVDDADITGVTLFDAGDGRDLMFLNGHTGDIFGSDINNFEAILLENSQITLADGLIDLNYLPDGGLVLQDNSLLDVGDGLLMSGNLAVDDTSRIKAFGGGSGDYTIVHSVYNHGIIDMQDGLAGDILSVGGNLIGGGLIKLDADYGNSQADTLVVLGDVTDGPMSLHFQNTTIGDVSLNDVLVAQIDGAVNPDGFVLSGPAIAGAYNFDLNQVGQDWFLQVAGFAPTAPLYEGYPQTLLAMNNLPTMVQRRGNTTPTGNLNNSNGLRGNAIITRIETSHTKFAPSSSTTGSDFDQNQWKLHAGLEGQLTENQYGRMLAGVTAIVGHGSSTIHSSSGNGEISTTTYGVAATATWFGQNGFYLDGQARLNWYSSDLSGTSIGTFVKNNDAFGYAISLEAGKRFAVSKYWTLTPQAQLIYSSVDFDSFTDVYGSTVTLDNGDSLRGRLGLSASRDLDVDGSGNSRNIYAIANLLYAFQQGTQVDVSGAKLISDAEKWGGEIGFGGAHAWAGGKYSLHGEITGRTSLSDFGSAYQIGGTAGFKVKF